MSKSVLFSPPVWRFFYIICLNMYCIKCYLTVFFCYAKREGGQYYVSVLVDYYLSCFYQSGTSGFSIRFGVAHNVSGVFSSCILCGRDFYDHRPRDDHFQSAKRQIDQKLRNRKGYGRQRIHDCRCIVWILHQSFLSCTVLVGCSLWSWCRKCGRFFEQLCCAPLCQQTYELAPLYVGNRRFARSLYHGLCVDKRTWLEYGVPLYSRFANPIDRHINFQSALMEKTRH